MHLDYSPSTKMLRAATHGRGVYEAYITFDIPVELSSFNASLENQKVILRWTTATETNNSHFEVERKFKNQDWEKIGEVIGAGTTTIPQSYSFEEDFSFKTYEGKILYRLKQVDFDGSQNYSNVVSVEVNIKPENFSLSQNYPNPFNPSTKIKFTVPGNAETHHGVSLKVYDILGNEIATLVNEEKPAGIYEVEFNSDNLSSGIYFYHYEAYDISGNKLYSELRKMLLLK